MTIRWVKPNASQLAQGILALRPISCYCSTDSGIVAVDYFGGYWTEIVGEGGKRKKVFIERRPAVIAYDYPMLLKFWRKHPDLMPRFIDVILPETHA